jgi:hypothetical protein
VTITNLDMRVLRRAVEIAGGEAELALRLEVSPHRLSVWLAAHAPRAKAHRRADRPAALAKRKWLRKATSPWRPTWVVFSLHDRSGDDRAFDRQLFAT